MTSPYLIALGSINVDFQTRADRAPAFGQLTVARDFATLGGGKAANVAYLARALGADVRLIGHVGADPLAPLALRELEEHGIDLSGVRALPSRATGAAWITVGPDGAKAIALATNANDVWTEEEAAAVAALVAAAPRGSVLVADLEVPAFVVRRALEAARGSGIHTVLDPSPPERMSAELFRLADYLTPDRAEAEALTGIPVRSAADGVAAGRTLVARGVRVALVKLGAGGCVVVDHEAQMHVPAVEVTPVDTTGAGDAFASAFGVALLAGAESVVAARYGGAAAALVVTHYGSRPTGAVREEVDRLVATAPPPRPPERSGQT